VLKSIPFQTIIGKLPLNVIIFGFGQIGWTLDLTYWLGCPFLFAKKIFIRKKITFQRNTLIQTIDGVIYDGKSATNCSINQIVSSSSFNILFEARYWGNGYAEWGFGLQWECQNGTDKAGVRISSTRTLLRPKLYFSRAV